MTALSTQHEFKINDICEVFSHSNQKWFQAQIIEEVMTTKRGKEFTVRYKVGNNYIKKRIASNSQDLREIDMSNNTEDVKCICGEVMVWILARDCYGDEKDKNEEKDEDEDEKESKLDIVPMKDSQGVLQQNNDVENKEDQSCVTCEGCGYKFSNDEQLFHCPKGKNEKHTLGSDLCYKCAKYEGDDEDTVQNVDMDEKKDDDTIASTLGVEPFAEGASRYAYLGLWETGKKKGTRCVIKRYKDKHLLFSDGFDGDIKCCKLAAELVQKWNEMKLVNKKYEIVVPVIARKGAKLWEVTLELSILLAIIGVEVDSLMQMLDTSDVGNQVGCGEVVMIEDFLSGDFLKWNSNSGWVGDENVTVQAFCHWTYHYSDREYLFCDAQGVRRAEKYILTDPAILSNTQKGGIYGITDCGRRYLLNWFRQHTCNKFCDPKWKKPSKIELDSVPQTVRKSIVKSTSFNQSQILKSQKLHCGSVMASITEECSSNATSNIVNKYEDKSWGAYDEYLSWQNGEEIVFCTKVTRIKTFGNQDCVLLLSSFEKLYILHPMREPGHDDHREYTKKQIVKTEVKTNNGRRLIIYLKNNTIHFDINDKKYDANSWKELIDVNMGCDANN